MKHTSLIELAVLLTAIVQVPLRAESKGVESAQLLTYVKPVLPATAQDSSPHAISFTATLGTDGKLHDLVPVSAENELTTAAKDAASQWVYVPYKRKGQPFEKSVYIMVFVSGREHTATPPTPVRVSNGVMARLADKQPSPLPSPVNGSGSAVLIGTIAKDGSVENAKVMSGPQPFAEPALRAVRQWTYKPYLLDGVPTEVETTMRVDFSR